MKKTILSLTLALTLLMANSGFATSQDKPKPKKDTVNMDTYAKPRTYYAVEDEKTLKSKGSNGGIVKDIVIVAGVLLIVGVTVYFLIKKKKQ